MDLVHIGLLALAVFCIWETAKPLLPGNLPDAAVAATLGATAYALDHWAPDDLIVALAIVAIVGVLHQRFGATTTASYALRLWPRRSASTMPPLPGAGR